MSKKLIKVLSKNKRTGDTAIHIATANRHMPNLLCLLEYYHELKSVDYTSLCNIDNHTPFHEIFAHNDIEFFQKLVVKPESTSTKIHPAHIGGYERVVG